MAGEGASIQWGREPRLHPLDTGSDDVGRRARSRIAEWIIVETECYRWLAAVGHVLGAVLIVAGAALGDTAVFLLGPVALPSR